MFSSITITVFSVALCLCPFLAVLVLCSSIYRLFVVV